MTFSPLTARTVAHHGKYPYWTLQYTQYPRSAWTNLIA